MSEAIISDIPHLDKSGGGFCAICRCRCGSCSCNKGVCTKCGCFSGLPEDPFA